MKAISAVIATIMLLMISVAMIGVFYVFSTTMATTTTGAGEEQASQLTSQLSSCMRIENINGNKVDLKNCGKGVIDNKSLTVTMDDTKLGSSLQTISEDSSGTVNVTGLWQIQPGKHNLKISNGATFAQALVDVSPNDDGLVGSWNFESVDASNYTIDASGNGNSGKLENYSCNPATCGLADGKFGKGLNFDGIKERILISGSSESLKNLTDDGRSFTFQTWFKPSGLPQNTNDGYIVFRTGYHEGIYYTKSSGELRAIIWYNDGTNSAINTGINLQSGTWYHLTMTVDETNNKFRLYMNGNQVGPTKDITLPLKTYAGPANYFIGGVGGYRAYGIVDEALIWSEALMPDDTVVMKQII